MIAEREASQREFDKIKKAHEERLLQLTRDLKEKDDKILDLEVSVEKRRADNDGLNEVKQEYEAQQKFLTEKLDSLSR